MLIKLQFARKSHNIPKKFLNALLLNTAIGQILRKTDAIIKKQA